MAEIGQIRPFLNVGFRAGYPLENELS